MILVIPEILIINGKCAFCIEGEEGTEKVYSDFAENPDKLCTLFRRENAKSLHVSDMDSFESGPENRDDIVKFTQSVDIPISYYRKFKDKNECEYYLNNGIYRTVLSSDSDLSFDEIKELTNKYTPSRIIYYLKSANGSINEDENLFQNLTDSGINRLQINNDSGSFSDETILQNLPFLKNKFRITLYGGVDSYKALAALLNLNHYGIDSVIIGKPLYENKFPCQKIWRLIEAELEK